MTIILMSIYELVDVRSLRILGIIANSTWNAFQHGGKVFKLKNPTEQLGWIFDGERQSPLLFLPSGHFVSSWWLLRTSFAANNGNYNRNVIRKHVKGSYGANLGRKFCSSQQKIFLPRKFSISHIKRIKFQVHNPQSLHFRYQLTSIITFILTLS